MKKDDPRCLGHRGRWTLAVWGIEEVGLEVFLEMRKVDFRCLGYQGRWTLWF